VELAPVGEIDVDVPTTADAVGDGVHVMLEDQGASQSPILKSGVPLGVLPKPQRRD